jgi:hypothetical protein
MKKEYKEYEEEEPGVRIQELGDLAFRNMSQQRQTYSRISNNYH